MTDAKDNLSIAFMINSILSSIPLPEDKQKEIKSHLFSNLAQNLGDDWDFLQVTSKRMAIVVFTLNSVLLPHGITPSKVADAVFKYSQEADLQNMTNEALEYLKPFASFSDDNFASLKANLGELGTVIKEKAQIIGSEVASKGKDLFGKLKDKIDKQKQSSEKKKK